MSVSIDWFTGIINIPQSYLTLISGTLYELDTNAFRLVLKALEDNEQGINFTRTHKHNTEVSLGGLSYARVIEILSPYTVTFEDGQYAVNLIGSNNNIADVTNVNQVSVRPSNSAGLISSKGIEALEYRGGVTIDVVNGEIGSMYPTGTLRKPVNNLADAKVIIEARGFNKLYIVGNITFGATDNIDNLKIEGYGHGFTTMTFISGCSTNTSEFKNADLQGTLDGGDQLIFYCNIFDLTNFSGIMYNCTFHGTIVLDGIEDVDLVNCVSGITGSVVPIIDMGGSGRGLIVRNHSGGLKLINKSGNDSINIDFISGQLQIDSTVTAGNIMVRGIGKVTQNDGTATIQDYGLVIGDEIRQLRDGNIKYEYHKATVQNDVRNVAVGELDYYISKVKNDKDSDWSSPISTKTKYMWYGALGDSNPINVGENG